MNPEAQAPNFTLDSLGELKLQLFNACTNTDPTTAVDGYATVILVVPCPLTNVAPAGMFQTTEVAFDGKPVMVYEYTLLGQVDTLITSI